MAILTYNAERCALRNAIHRCHNDQNIAYRNYGGRTTNPIRVCDEWRYQTSGFQAFLNHIGPRPSSEHSLDRIDNDGHYEPGNVRWAPDRQTQQRNRRPTSGKRQVRDFGWGLAVPVRNITSIGGALSPLIPLKGRLQTLCDWADEKQMNPATIRQRLERGLTPEQALNPCVSRAGARKKSNAALYLPETKTPSSK